MVVCCHINRQEMADNCSGATLAKQQQHYARYRLADSQNAEYYGSRRSRWVAHHKNGEIARDILSVDTCFRYLISSLNKQIAC